MDGAGIPVEFSKGESGKGQHEINITYADALTTADRHALYKHGTKEIAALNGRRSRSWRSRRWTRRAPRATCTRACGTETAPTSLMWDDDDPNHMSATFRHARRVDGDRARDGLDVRAVRELLQALPARIVGADRDPVEPRQPHVRVPVVGEHQGFRVESRMPGADVNPYLAFAATIAAGLHGIQNEIDAPQLFEGNAYEAKDAERVPSSLHEAIAEMERSEVMREAFGDFVFEPSAEHGPAGADHLRQQHGH